MKYIVLTDHASDQIAAAQKSRQAEHAKAEAAYRVRVAPMADRSAWINEQAQQAWKTYRYLTWFFLKATVHLHDFFCGLFGPRAPSLAPAGQSEAVWSAGSRGEQLVKNKLAALSDDFVLISGYSNQKGEIDQILVGPNGVICIEVKYMNGHISCAGDAWWRDKHDNYGNVVEKNVPIQDKGGRGPSAQVNASADRLQDFLRHRSSVQRVYRAVVFSHESSVLVSVKAPTVDVVTDLKTFAIAHLIDELARHAAAINVVEVVSLIRRDHAFNEQKAAQFRAARGVRA